MSEWFALAALAASLYLIECVVWIEAHAIACFRTSLRRGWRCAEGAALPGNDRGGVVLLDFAAVGGSIVTCHRWPFSLSPAGVTNLAFEGAHISEADAAYLPFDHVMEVHAEVGDIYINGTRIARLGSTVLASRLADQIKSVWKCPLPKRPLAIQRAVAAALDHEAAREAWTAFQARTTVLGICCECLFAFAFIAAPLSVVLIGPYPTWMYLLAIGAGLTLATSFTYFRLHTALFPQSRYNRWVNALSMVMFPVAAIRCIDKLSKDALSGYSWAVVAPLLCTREDAARLARVRLIDMRAWVDDDRRIPESPATRCARWFHDLLTAEITATLDRLSVPAMVPPVPEDETMVCFCPRCHAQFRKQGTDCPACAVRLALFADARNSGESGGSHSDCVR